MIVGFVERYGDYYEYYSLTQECKRQIKQFENRYTRFSENYDGKYLYGDMTAYSYLSLEGILLSHAMRTAHPIMFNCLYSLKNEVFQGSIEYISHLQTIDQIRMLLNSDLPIFDAIYNIMVLTVDGVIAGKVALDPDSLFWHLLRIIASDVGVRDKHGELPIINYTDRKTGRLFTNLNYW